LRSAWVRVLLVPQHCLLRAALEKRLGAGAAGRAALFAARGASLEKRMGAGASRPAALFAARDAGEALGCGCCWSRGIICCPRRLRSAWVRVLLVPQPFCCARRLRSAWVRVLLVPQHCLLRAALEKRMGAGAAGPAAFFAARGA
jgi:ribosomal protein L16/L10AE